MAMTVAENICSLADPYARSFLLYDVNEMQLSLIYIVAVERERAVMHVFMCLNYFFFLFK